MKSEILSTASKSFMKVIPIFSSKNVSHAAMQSYISVDFLFLPKAAGKKTPCDKTGLCRTTMSSRNLVLLLEETALQVLVKT